MKTITLVFLFVCIGANVWSQNIFSSLWLNDREEYKSRRPKRIVETNTFYIESGKRVDKNVKEFDAAGMVQTEERFNDEGKLTARLTYTNDTVRRIKLTRIFERWNQFGYSKETATYEYDAKYNLIGTTDTDGNGNVIQRTVQVCNEKGHPSELSVFNANGTLFGKEVASYLYDRNLVITSVVSSDGKTLSSDTTKISYSHASEFPSDYEVYNERGDLTKWRRLESSGSYTYFEEEYEYDSYGNSTENKIFKVTVKRSGSRQRKIDRIFRKEYYY
jgi:hypothetical protein